MFFVYLRLKNLYVNFDNREILGIIYFYFLIYLNKFLNYKLILEKILNFKVSYMYL